MCVHPPPTQSACCVTFHPILTCCDCLLDCLLACLLLGAADFTLATLQCSHEEELRGGVAPYDASEDVPPRARAGLAHHNVNVFKHVKPFRKRADKTENPTLVREWRGVRLSTTRHVAVTWSVVLACAGHMGSPCIFSVPGRLSHHTPAVPMCASCRGECERQEWGACDREREPL